MFSYHQVCWNGPTLRHLFQEECGTCIAALIAQISCPTRLHVAGSFAPVSPSTCSGIVANNGINGDHHERKCSLQVRRGGKQAAPNADLLAGWLVGATNLGSVLPENGNFLHRRKAHQLEVLHRT